MQTTNTGARDTVRADILEVNEPPYRRVSWGAIFAGVVVAVAIQIMLGLLGLGIGLTQIDPASEENPLSGLGSGAAIWSILTILIALFIGGWIAGRLAGVPRKTTGTLHGLVVWGLATIFMVYLTTSAVGRVVGGAMSVVGSAARAAGQGIGAAAPAVADRVSDRMEQSDVDWSDIRREAMTVLRQTGDPDLQPENLEQEAREAGRAADQRVQAAGQPGTDAEAELSAAMDRVFNRAGDVASEVDKQDLANVLAARTDMSPQEARQRVDEWDRRYQGIRDAASSQAQDVGQRTAEMTETATDAVGRAAIWTFVGLLLAAIAAALGGGAGAPKLIEERHAEVPLR